MSEKRLAGLDGLRGIAAISILAFHLMPFLAGDWRGNAYLAVDFFFMLSGYVMARTYEVRLADDLTPLAFMWQRWKRPWPTLFVGSLMGLPWFLSVMGSDHMLVVMANLLLIPTFVFNWIYPLDGPVWSIFFELFANLIHALLLRRLPIRMLALLTLLMVAILVIPASQLTLGLGNARHTFPFGFPRVIMSYSIGIILWRIWRDEPSIAISPAFAFLVMPVFFGAAMIADSNAWLSDFLFVLILCPLMIAGALRWTGPSIWACRAGALSFPLYAFHVPILATTSLAGLNIGWGVMLSLTAAWLFSRLSVLRAALFPVKSVQMT